MAARSWWAGLLALALICSGAAAVADEATEAVGGTAPPATEGGRSQPGLRDLDQWLEQSAQQQTPLPAEARLAYRHGQFAWKANQEAEAVRLMRGAAELDPSFAAPHLTLASWFLTREPSQALLSWAALLHRLRDDFTLQLELAANAIVFALQAIFFGLLAAAVILVGLHQHELRHVWRERLGVVLAPRSAQIWAWVFLLMPWVLGIGLALPALVMLAMLWPVLKGRERAVFIALAVLVGVAPLAPRVMGRLALPLQPDGAPFYGVTALDQRDYSAEDHARVAELAQQHPDRPYVQFGLGWLARRAGDLETAERAYRRTLERWPASDETLNNLGNLLAMQGRFDEALESFRKATEANPGAAASHFNASQVHTRLFDYQAASDAVARASALDFEMVKAYQARSGESGDLPLVDRWIDAATCWRTLLDAPEADVVPALPPAWRGMIETSGWPFVAAALTLTLAGLILGLWWQRRMPLRSCSNCERPVCRRCAQRLREVALCPECAMIAGRAESGEFGRVLLLQQRRKVDRLRSMVRTAGAAVVPGLGLLARQRVFGSLVLLIGTSAILAQALGRPAPFALSDEFGPGSVGGWGLVVCGTLVYAASLIGYLRAPDPSQNHVRVTSPQRPSRLADHQAEAA